MRHLFQPVRQSGNSLTKPHPRLRSLLLLLLHGPDTDSPLSPSPFPPPPPSHSSSCVVDAIMLALDEKDAALLERHAAIASLHDDVTRLSCSLASKTSRLDCLEHSFSRAVYDALALVEDVQVLAGELGGLVEHEEDEARRESAGDVAREQVQQQLMDTVGCLQAELGQSRRERAEWLQEMESMHAEERAAREELLRVGDELRKLKLERGEAEAARDNAAEERARGRPDSDDGHVSHQASDGGHELQAVCAKEAGGGGDFLPMTPPPRDTGGGQGSVAAKQAPSGRGHAQAAGARFGWRAQNGRRDEDATPKRRPLAVVASNGSNGWRRESGGGDGNTSISPDGNKDKASAIAGAKGVGAGARGGGSFGLGALVGNELSGLIGDLYEQAIGLFGTNVPILGTAGDGACGHAGEETAYERLGGTVREVRRRGEGSGMKGPDDRERLRYVLALIESAHREMRAKDCVIRTLERECRFFCSLSCVLLFAFLCEPMCLGRPENMRLRLVCQFLRARTRTHTHTHTNAHTQSLSSTKSYLLLYLRSLARRREALFSPLPCDVSPGLHNEIMESAACTLKGNDSPPSVNRLCLSQVANAGVLSS
jgi:hypothetical protein